MYLKYSEQPFFRVESITRFLKKAYSVLKIPSLQSPPAANSSFAPEQVRNCLIRTPETKLIDKVAVHTEQECQNNKKKRSEKTYNEHQKRNFKPNRPQAQHGFVLFDKSNNVFKGHYFTRLFPAFPSSRGAATSTIATSTLLTGIPVAFSMYDLTSRCSAAQSVGRLSS